MKFLCKVPISSTSIIDIYVDKNRSDGCVEYNEFDGNFPKIIIGLNCISLNCADTLHHELMELIATDMGIRFKRTSQMGDGEYIFVFNHCQFEELSQRATAAFLFVYPKLFEIYIKLMNKPKKEKTKK